MKILVIDTAFEQCQVGLWDGTKNIAHESVLGGGQHDRILAPMVERIMQHADFPLARLDRILVTTGPGRFTGLRVGIAFARGLSLVHNTPLSGVSTMDALAWEWEWEHAADFTPKNGYQRILLVAVKRGETYAMRMAPHDSVLEQVKDDDFVNHFGTEQNLCFAGMVSSDVAEIISKQSNMIQEDNIQYPSLKAIFSVGSATQYNAATPVRPHYALP